MKAWAMVPARGGSKSIPYKNLAVLAGRALIDYGVLAVQASGRCERIVCSTEDQRVAEHAETLGIEVDTRPTRLAGDDTAVADVARDFLARATAPLPDVLVLIQPTSPFLLPQHIGALLDRIASNPSAQSAQTVAAIPHNHHAWNQRVVTDPVVHFAFREERARAYNKQSKPKLYAIGNLVMVRPAALRLGLDFFAEPSVALEIPRPYDFDVDTAEDLALASAIMASGAVSLSHLGTTL